MNTNEIRKQILLRAPLDRVWNAISDAQQFGRWFGMRLNGPFQAGQDIHGTIAPTEVNDDIAKKQKPYEGTPVQLKVQQIEPQRLFSFRWHPFAIEPGMDYASEPTTLVSFELEAKPEGVLVTISESGFDQIPIERRAKAFAANEQGWALQTTMLEAYLDQER